METCTICARGALADEHGRCERCVADANRRAVIFDELNHAVEAALESGLTPNQLHEAFELALNNRAGVLAGDCVVRQARTGGLRGVAHPPGVFMGRGPAH